MKLKIYFLAMLFLASLGAYSQAFKVNGNVKDDSKMPLPGVSVVVKGTAIGTTTDFDGNFTLNVTKGNILVFSYVGYNNKEVTVSTNANINVVMAAGVELQEVVVVGSRNVNRTAVDTPVPVDVIDMKELSSASPQVNLNQILNYVAPSFTQAASRRRSAALGCARFSPSIRG